MEHTIPQNDDEAIEFWHEAGNVILRRINESGKTGVVVEATNRLMGRIVQSGNSLSTLYYNAQHDWSWDGAALLRIIYDTMIQALYVMHDPSERDVLAQRFLDYEAIEHRKSVRVIDRRETAMAKQLADSPKRAASEREWKDKFDRVCTKYGYNPDKPPQHWYSGALKELADKAGYKTEFEFIHPQLSGAVHSSYFAIRGNMPYSRYHYVHMGQLMAFRVVASLAEYAGIAFDEVESFMVKVARANFLDREKVTRDGCDGSENATADGEDRGSQI